MHAHQVPRPRRDRAEIAPRSCRDRHVISAAHLQAVHRLFWLISALYAPQYETLGLIGRGGSGDVYLVHKLLSDGNFGGDRTTQGTMYAMKRIRKSARVPIAAPRYSMRTYHGMNLARRRAFLCRALEGPRRAPNPIHRIPPIHRRTRWLISDAQLVLLHHDIRRWRRPDAVGAAADRRTDRAICECGGELSMSSAWCDMSSACR